MKISGFTFVRNATKYYYPVKESIQSVLPVVDEFIVALGEGDPEDGTREEIESIGSEKIRIFDRVWDEALFVDGKIYAHETNFALSQCTGDWCFYIQADEVIHERDHPTILGHCSDYLTDPRVDGFLFHYYHFYGDYDHYLPFHGWYKNEIRIVRNHIGVYSIKDAQSFRKKEDEKLNVLGLDARVYHYGWVRPPELMQSKRKEQDSMYEKWRKKMSVSPPRPKGFDYGPLGRIPRFRGEHPPVMESFRKRIYWKDQLNYSRKGGLNREKFKHEKLKNRVLSFFENSFYGGKEIFGYSNWNRLSPYK